MYLIIITTLAFCSRSLQCNCTNVSGIQGYISHIDENGDAEGNYTLLSRQPYKTNLSDYSMRPVGHFEMDKNYNGLPVSLYISCW
jgi:hypothetical protein